MLQTVPALALLVFMIPLFGIGKGPALVALSLYALLPIVRSTYAGLIGIDRHLLEIAFVLGLGRLARLLRIELPLASSCHGGDQDLRRHDGGYGHARRVHRRRRLWSADRAGLGAGRHRDDPGRGRARRGMAVAFHVLFEFVDRLAIPRGLRRYHSRRGP